jgi:Ca2+-binding RTX toxin-like protein
MLVGITKLVRYTVVAIISISTLGLLLSSLTQAEAKVFLGTSGDDSIVGTTKDDIMIGKEGDDTLNGGDDPSGDDVIDGGPGNDNLFGEGDADHGGNDVVIGGQGNDQLTGGPGADVFRCGSGTDSIGDFKPEEGDIKTNDCESF